MNEAVTTYISAQEPWKQTVLNQIRQIVHAADPDIVEQIKWGTPSFEHAGQVCWTFCAAEWVHLSFRHGVLLHAPDGTWEEGSDTATKAMRTIRFREGDEVPAELLTRLVKEAAANNVAGRKVDFGVTKPGSKKFDLPAEYETVLKSRGVLDDYRKRPYYQQKGWIQWIELAKQPETKQKRIEKMIQEIEEGSYMPPKG